MVGKHYKAVMVGILGFLIFGVSMAYIGYSTTVYPLDKARGYLDRVASATSPEAMMDYLASAQPLVPKEGNPVWAFPTARTDFGLMQDTMAGMMDRLRTLSTLPRDSDAYQNGLQDLRWAAGSLEKDVMEAQPYVYVSFQNVVLSAIWIAVLLMIFTVMKRGKEKLKEYETLEGGENIQP
ncbi:MAG: hypothetical protein ACE5J2_05225 [Nitrososphaerales archaeon]